MDLMMYADNELDHQQRKHLRADLRVSRELQARIRPFIETRAALLTLNK
jgi:anti-sigma factor RsiW